MPHSRLAAKIRKRHLRFGNKQRVPAAIQGYFLDIFGRHTQIIPATFIFVVYYGKVYPVPINECKMLRCQYCFMQSGICLVKNTLAARTAHRLYFRIIIKRNRSITQHTCFNYYLLILLEITAFFYLQVFQPLSSEIGNGQNRQIKLLPIRVICRQAFIFEELLELFHIIGLNTKNIERFKVIHKTRFTFWLKRSVQGRGTFQREFIAFQTYTSAK